VCSTGFEVAQIGPDHHESAVSEERHHAYRVRHDTLDLGRPQHNFVAVAGSESVIRSRFALCCALALWSENEETRVIRLVACIAATGVTNTEGNVPYMAITGMAL
jgi:hypothetical protein